MPMTIRYEVSQPNPIIDFAANELRRFLEAAFSTELTATDWSFRLATDTRLPPFAFAVEANDTDVRLSGHDSAAVLHAVYTALERAGYCFEITGPRLTETADIEPLRGWNTTIQPAVNWRGIRQHLNFPMDISSYPLDEALDYLRNLARLRLNHITFHSYPDQWYAVDLPSGGRMLAGGYFYGQRHDIPDHPILKSVIRNDHTFCIPEIEPYIDQPEENSRRAIIWLQAVIREAKRVGLRVQFSFELREQILADSLATVNAILDAYPEIDGLEIITQETGDWASAPPVETLRDLVAQYFGLDALADDAIARHLVAGQKDLDKLVREIGHNIEVLKAIKEQRPALPQLTLGVYCTVRSDQAVVLALLERYVPPDVSFALLFDHGNRAVARNLHALNMPRADWDRTMIYSWIEFDGTMYLFQNAVHGIYQLLALAHDVYHGDPIPAISFNHWRTAENQTSARYAAEALLHGPLDPQAFYRHYAKSLKLGHADDYASALALLDDADSQARNELPNVGFCYVGVWWHEGLGYYGIFKPDRLAAVRTKYEAAQALLRGCREATASAGGQHYLDFIDNRVFCTIIYLQAIEAATALQPLCLGKAPGELTGEEQQQVRAVCARALDLMEHMMALHAQFIVDRGSEGTLISFYYTPPAVLKRICADYGGQSDAATPYAQASKSDAPPSPIWLGDE